MRLKALLGLRSPVHTLVRGLNPFGAAAAMHGVFHPGYVAIHRDAALALGDKRVLVFRGDGGEGERRPGKPCDTLLIAEGRTEETRWPAVLDVRQVADEASISTASRRSGAARKWTIMQGRASSAPLLSRSGRWASRPIRRALRRAPKRSGRGAGTAARSRLWPDIRGGAPCAAGRFGPVQARKTKDGSEWSVRTKS